MTHKHAIISVEEALDIILSHVSPTLSETLPLQDAYMRITSQDITTDIDLAPFDNSAMDGFAVRSIDVANASEANPIALSIVGHIGAGATYENELQTGQAVRIMTGAPIPLGADAVEMIEHVEVSSDGSTGDTVTIKQSVAPGKNVRFAGEEARAGDVITPKGTILTSAWIGLCASGGAHIVHVYKKPRVGIISLGSELVDIERVPQKSQIRNSNAQLLHAAIQEAGCEPVPYGIVEDDMDAIYAAIHEATKTCDFVLTTGGASSGDFDYVAPIAQQYGQMFFHYVNMRPGKSQVFAMINDTPFLGLAGNPSATAVGFEILVRPALKKMQGLKRIFRPVQDAIVMHPIHKKATRRHYIRGYAYRNEYDELVVEQAGNQSSAQLSALAHGNCLMMILPEQIPVEAGEEIEIVRIDLPEGALV